MKIDKNEVKRYMGYKSELCDKNIDAMIDDCILEMQKESSSLSLYGIYDIEISDAVYVLKTGIVLLGDDIKNHLKGCEKIALIAATLGTGADIIINRYGKIDVAKALVADACATALIESLCDDVQDKIAQIARREGFFLTPRFSPGYGDLPITSQTKIIRALGADKHLGISVTKEDIMIPLKSVTAIVGFSKNAVQSCSNKCSLCKNNKNCKFSRI